MCLFLLKATKNGSFFFIENNLKLTIKFRIINNTDFINNVNFKN